MWHSDRVPQWPPDIEYLQIQSSCNSFKFFKFLNSGPKYLEKCRIAILYPCNIILVFDKVEGVEYEAEVKTGTGSSFRRHFGEKLILGIFGLLNPVAMGRTRSIFGTVS